MVEGQIDHPDFTSVLLDTDYLCLAVAPGHRLAGRSSVALPELKNEKFILRSRAAGTRTLFENYLMSHSESIRSLNVIMEMDSVATIKELVALGMGTVSYTHLDVYKRQPPPPRRWYGCATAGPYAGYWR